MTSNVKQEELYKELDDILDHESDVIHHNTKDNIVFFINQQVIQALERVKDLDALQGEIHVSHVCPEDNIGCAKFSARGQMRNALVTDIDNLIKEYKGDKG